MGAIVIDARDAAATEIRGWGRYARELVAALQDGAANGLEIDAVTAGGPGPEVAFEQLWLPLLLRRRQAALVHAPNCFLPLVRPCPGVVTINDLAFEAWPGDFTRVTGAKFRMFTRLAARSAQRIICPSQFTADDVCRRYRIDPGKVRVIADAPALARAPAPRTPPRPDQDSDRAGFSPTPYLLAVGDLRAKKNLAALVGAFVDLVRDQGIAHRLVLAGADSGEGARLAELAAGAPVQLTGYVTDARLDDLISGAELLVHPSRYEGFGLVVLDAMARGTPVLAARAAALPETGGAAAAYFDPTDPADLRRQLEALLGDGARRVELARLGLARAGEFSWQRTARETAAVYRELL